MADWAGVPPTGGGWWEYHRFSAQLTMPLPPWPRNHSAPRAATEVPSPGSARALPSEIQTGVSSTTAASTAVATGCRPAIVRRAARIRRRACRR